MITSVTNSKIKNICKLNDSKERKKEKLFIVEGEHLVSEAFKHNYLVESFSLKEYDYPNNTLVSINVMKKITNLHTPPSIIGICKFKEEKNIGNKILILDGVQDPGNLGTIIRSAVAFNIDTIVLSNDTVDLYNPKVIRSTQGMIFNINIIKKDIYTFILSLKQNNYKIYSTNVVNGIQIKDVVICEKYAIIVGNEGNGVKENIQKLSDENIYIHTNPLCESLNVGVATGIILYELFNR